MTDRAMSTSGSLRISEKADPTPWASIVHPSERMHDFQSKTHLCRLPKNSRILHNSTKGTELCLERTIEGQSERVLTVAGTSNQGGVELLGLVSRTESRTLSAWQSTCSIHHGKIPRLIQ